MNCTKCGRLMECLQDDPLIYFCPVCNITHKGDFEVEVSLNGHTE